ncbi:hypothetical protein BN1326_30010 [Staphylococcus argenteus]|uniref:Uncharacterized protein n=1 Tax=Staphylococcus argenteus TaxID=985002 RepID=A0A7U7JS26_9STAP|nr:hypothetical protein BN1326_30010 [Staphylococcus argenteus]CRI19989.1 hypothetical protein BN1326_30010 [Staphylococcus argenteus]
MSRKTQHLQDFIDTYQQMLHIKKPRTEMMIFSARALHICVLFI